MKEKLKYILAVLALIAFGAFEFYRGTQRNLFKSENFIRGLSSFILAILIAYQMFVKKDK